MSNSRPSLPSLAPQASKTDQQKMKDILEQFQEFETLIKGSKMSRGATNVESFESEISNLEKRIAEYQERLTAVKKAKDFYEGLPFKMGDAAFHKDYGNVLITGISINQDDFTDSKYAVRAVNGDFRVNIKDLVPITEATKALFGRNK